MLSFLVCLILSFDSTASLRWQQSLQHRNYRVSLANDDTTILAPKGKSMEDAASLAMPESESELKSLMDNMPLNEKYSLLLQSYSTNILEGKVEDTKEAIVRMSSLYNEMIQKSIIPDNVGAKSYIDAAASFCNIATLSQAARYVKAGGIMNAFGAANSQLTNPIMSKSASTLMEVKIPTDDREAEIFYSGLVALTLASEAVLQAVSVANSDFQPWVSVFNGLVLLLGVLDVSLRQGAGLRKAAAGIERLVFMDTERQAHCDGSAFLVAYLLGLPCFCFKPDVVEAMKLLCEYPSSLDVYKQPAAIRASGGAAAAVVAMAAGGEAVGSSFNQIFQDLRKSFQLGSGGSNTRGSSGADAAGTASATADTVIQRVDLDTDLEVYLENDAKSLKADQQRGLGRVLVWLMVPAAAEYLKYGKTILSDPRRGERLLALLADIKQGGGVSKSDKKVAVAAATSRTRSSDGDGDGDGDSRSSDSSDLSDDATTSGRSTSARFTYDQTSIPEAAEDRQALLDWAYFEATTLVRQYGDLLEEVQLYMNTGTSTVGECVLMIEEELS